jgi:hypothetical protein
MDKSIKAGVSWTMIEGRGHGNEKAGKKQCKKQAISAERCYQQLFYPTAKRKSENHDFFPDEPSEETDVVVNNHHSRIVGGGKCRGDSVVGSQEADDKIYSNN